MVNIVHIKYKNRLNDNEQKNEKDKYMQSLKCYVCIPV